jgi:hypothetical protein
VIVRAHPTGVGCPTSVALFSCSKLALISRSVPSGQCRIKIRLNFAVEVNTARPWGDEKLALPGWHGLLELDRGPETSRVNASEHRVAALAVRATSRVLDRIGRVAGQQALRDLVEGVRVRRCTEVEDPDDVEAISRPLLGDRGMVTHDDVGDGRDVLVLPADQRGIPAGHGVRRNLVDIALPVRLRSQPQLARQGSNRLDRSLTAAAALRFGREEELGLRRTKENN